MDREIQNALATLSASTYWDVVKKDFLEPLIKEVKDVTKPIKYGDEQIPLKDSIVAKIIAAKFLEDIIEEIDRAKVVEKKTSIDSYN